MRCDTRGFLQTRFPARRSAEGFAIDGPAHTLTVRFLSDIGNCLIEPWPFSHGNPGTPQLINSLQYDDAYYRPHSVQVTLLSFGTPTARCDRTDHGLTIDIKGQRLVFAEDAAGVLRLAQD
jgi:hypothetical protein